MIYLLLFLSFLFNLNIWESFLVELRLFMYIIRPSNQNVNKYYSKCNIHIHITYWHTKYKILIITIHIGIHLLICNTYEITLIWYNLSIFCFHFCDPFVKIWEMKMVLCCLGSHICIKQKWNNHIFVKLTNCVQFYCFCLSENHLI